MSKKIIIKVAFHYKFRFQVIINRFAYLVNPLRYFRKI
jgi:hypothetical protein